MAVTTKLRMTRSRKWRACSRSLKLPRAEELRCTCARSHYFTYFSHCACELGVGALFYTQEYWVSEIEGSCPTSRDNPVGKLEPHTSFPKPEFRDVIWRSLTTTLFCIRSLWVTFLGVAILLFCVPSLILKDLYLESWVDALQLMTALGWLSTAMVATRQTTPKSVTYNITHFILLSSQWWAVWFSSGPASTLGHLSKWKFIEETVGTHRTTARQWLSVANKRHINSHKA